MKAKGKIKVMSLDQMKDMHLGKKGTIERDEYEMELRVEILGEMIRTVRKEKNLTQEQLGKLMGVNKSQISKLEKNTKNVTIETILRVFRALKTNIKFTLERSDENLELV
jgi:DNA-binding XRE family transcriptional regulator